MRKGIVVLALVIGSVALPATPALAGHCTRPLAEPVAMAKWLLCELSHLLR